MHPTCLHGLTHANELAMRIAVFLHATFLGQRPPSSLPFVLCSARVTLVEPHRRRY